MPKSKSSTRRTTGNSRNIATQLGLPKVPEFNAAGGAKEAQSVNLAVPLYTPPPAYGAAKSSSFYQEPYVTYREPAYLAPSPQLLRRKAGIGIPGFKDVMETVAGGTIGALIGAVFITAVGDEWKALAAILGGVGGIFFAGTSPVGTIPQEMGVGGISTSIAWLFFKLTGQI